MNNVRATADRDVSAADGPAELTEAEMDAATAADNREHILASLAALPHVDYGQRRKALADELGVPVSYLDKERKERRSGEKRESEMEARWKTEPWPDVVEGGELLDRLAAVTSDHMVLPDGAAKTVALWVMFAHAHDAFGISPLLAITSPTLGCGKTTLLTLLGALVPRPLQAANITISPLFRAVEKWQPTLLIDEADTFLRNNEELRGVLNSGHQRWNACVVRSVGDDHEPTMFKTWSPKAIALIGKLPATLASRSIHIELKRKAAVEKVKALRLDRLDDFAPLMRQAARWAVDNMDGLGSAEPDMPDALHGRDADNWRPLLAIADLCGGAWPRTARRIACAFSITSTSDTIGVELLADVRSIFSERQITEITTNDLIDALVAMETRPWSEWGRLHKPITPHALSKLLEPFGIKPGQYWSGGKKRGYLVKHFQDAFARYLGDSSGRPVEAAETGESQPIENGRRSDGLPLEMEPKPQENRGVYRSTTSKTPMAVCRHCGEPARADDALQECHDGSSTLLLHRACQRPWLEGAA